MFSSESRPSRGDVAGHLLANRALIRRRVLGRLRRAGMLWIDADDVTSSVLRRIDAAMMRGVVRTHSEREFWAYVIAVADNVAIARIRRASRAWARDGAGTLGNPPPESAAPDDRAVELLHQMVMSLPDTKHRELLLWRLGGASYRAIAAATGQSETALRARWTCIRRDLRARFAEFARG